MITQGNLRSVVISFLYPILASIFYITSRFILSKYKKQLNNFYKNNENYKSVIKYVGALHNLFMTLFSALFFMKLYHLVLAEYGSVINHKAWLDNHLITNQDILNLCWIFCHSKIVEYIDTFLILFKGGSPIFLQKYHHFGAVWVWFLLLYVDSSAVIITCLYNSFVHTVMYFYYFLSIFDRRKVLMKVKPFITLLQLIQLSYGYYPIVRYYVLAHFKDVSKYKYSITCSAFMLYDFILIILFLDFSYKQYVRKDTKLN